MRRVLRVIGHILKARVRREKPKQYQRLEHKEAERHTGTEDSSCTNTNVDEVKSKATNWNVLRNHAVVSPKRRELRMQLTHLIRKSSQTHIERRVRREAGMYRQGDNFPEEDAGMNRCLSSLLSIIHECVLEGGVSGNCTEILDGAVFRLCVQTIETPSLRPTSRSVVVAAGIIFNLTRREETRQVLLSHPHFEDYILEMIQCILRDSIREEKEVDDLSDSLPTFSTSTSTLLIASLRHLAVYCEERRSEQVNATRYDAQKSNGFGFIDPPARLLPILRRVVPALLLMLRSAALARDIGHAVNVSHLDSEHAAKLNAEALDLLHALGPISKIQLKRRCAAVSHGSSSKRSTNQTSSSLGLMSQRTVDHLRVARLEREEKRRVLARGGIGGGGGGEGIGVGAQRRGNRRRNAIPIHASTLGKSKRGIMSALVDGVKLEELKSRLVLNNNSDEGHRLYSDTAKHDRIVRHDIAKTSAEFDRDADDVDIRGMRSVGVDSVLWIGAAHEVQVYENLLLQERGSVAEYERTQTITEHRRKGKHDSLQFMSKNLIKYGNTFLGDHDLQVNPYHHMITTDSKTVDDVGQTLGMRFVGDKAKQNDGSGSDDSSDISIDDSSEDESAMDYFRRIEEDAKEKRDDLRETLLEWKEEMDADPIVSVNPVLRQEKLKELAKLMLEDDLI